MIEPREFPQAHRSRQSQLHLVCTNMAVYSSKLLSVDHDYRHSSLTSCIYQDSFHPIIRSGSVKILHVRSDDNSKRSETWVFWTCHVPEFEHALHSSFGIYILGKSRYLKLTAIPTNSLAIPGGIDRISPSKLATCMDENHTVHLLSLYPKTAMLRRLGCRSLMPTGTSWAQSKPISICSVMIYSAMLEHSIM